VASGVVVERAVLQSANGSQFYKSDGLHGGSCKRTCLADGFRLTTCDRACNPSYEYLGKEPVPFYISVGAKMNASSADVRRVAEGAENGARLEEWRAIRPTKKQVGGCAYDCMDKCVQACPAGFNAKRCGDLCAPQCHRHCGQ
jgi:hypothetical protein